MPKPVKVLTSLSKALGYFLMHLILLILAGFMRPNHNSTMQFSSFPLLQTIAKLEWEYLCFSLQRFKTTLSKKETNRNCGYLLPQFICP